MLTCALSHTKTRVCKCTNTHWSPQYKSIIYSQSTASEVTIFTWERQNKGKKAPFLGSAEAMLIHSNIRSTRVKIHWHMWHNSAPACRPMLKCVAFLSPRVSGWRQNKASELKSMFYFYSELWNCWLGDRKELWLKSYQTRNDLTQGATDHVSTFDLDFWPCTSIPGLLGHDQYKCKRTRSKVTQLKS